MEVMKLSDPTDQYRYQRMLVEAAQYRTLRRIFKADPAITPPTASLIRDILADDRDDAIFVHKITRTD